MDTTATEDTTWEGKENKSDFRLTRNFKNIWAGSYPRYDDDIKMFDVVINVSDNVALSLSPPTPGQIRLWFPIMEMSNWDLGNVYAVMRTLQRLDDGKRNILIHCAAGANRSPTMITFWKLFRELPLDTKWDELDIECNMSKGREYVPINLKDLFEVMKVWPTHCAESCVREAGFLDRAYSTDLRKRQKRLHRWYYLFRIKWAIQSWLRKFDLKHFKW